jgi:membrane associated rhomboid family serine protease
MGIENREYLRNDYQDGPQRASFTSVSILVKLIVATVAVFILQLLFYDRATGSTVTQWLQLTGPDLYQRGQVWRLVTYAFCHDENLILHLIFNMMMLYFAGGMLLHLLGEREFLWFYLASAVFAGICSVAYYAIVRESPSIVGASGAVFAVFCAVTLHYPRRVVLLFGVVPLEMRWLLVISVALPVFLAPNSAHSAHIGGVLFGAMYVRLHMNLTRWWDLFAGRVAMRRRNKGKLKIFAPPAPPDSNLEVQMDQILAKISREGEASLTARERNILTQASRQLRKDRS